MTLTAQGRSRRRSLPVSLVAVLVGAAAMELAYMWPSFDNGIPLYPQLTPAQHELSDWMVRYWGAFARFGIPFVRGQAFWPPYQTGRMMSLRQGSGSIPISDAEFSAEHNCAFWNSLPGS